MIQNALAQNAINQVTGAQSSYVMVMLKLPFSMELSCRLFMGKLYTCDFIADSSVNKER